MLLLHGQIAVAVVRSRLILGIRGLGNALHGAGASPGYRGALVVGEGLALVQVVLGAALRAAGPRPPAPIHDRHSALVLPLLPVIHGLARGQPARRGRG